MLIKGTGNMGILIWLGAYRDVSMKMGIVQELSNLAPPPDFQWPMTHTSIQIYGPTIIGPSKCNLLLVKGFFFFFWPNCDRSIQIHIIHLLDKFQVEVVNSMYHHQGKRQWGVLISALEEVT